MSFVLRKQNSGRRFSPRAVGVLAALTVGASLLTAPQAFADDTPSNRELLQACNWASFCKFRPQSYREYTGPRHQVGDTTYNCGHLANPHQVGWSDTTLASNSVGLSLTAGYKFAEVFEFEVTTTYQHTWQNSHTDTESNSVNIPVGYKGWVERGVAKQQATGWWEIQFRNKFHGHFVWYVYNYTESGFNKDHPQYGYTNLKDAVMTTADRNQHC